MNKYKIFSKVHLHIKNNMCERKKAFDTKELAYQKGQNSYKCPHCTKYHRASINKVKGSMKGFSLCSAG